MFGGLYTHLQNNIYIDGYTLIYKYVWWFIQWIYIIYIERERFKSIETLPWHGWVLQLPVVADSADSGGRDSSRLLPQLPTAFTCGGFARLLCSIWTSSDIIWHDPSYKLPQIPRNVQIVDSKYTPHNTQTALHFVCMSQPVSIKVPTPFLKPFPV